MNDLQADDQPTLFDAGVRLTEPVLPYGGTSGWSGSDTSRERADQADVSGVTSKRQQGVLELLEVRRTVGATWVDVSKYLNLHHGSASGALSALHKTGHVSRLTERHNGSLIYVLPQYVAGRPTSPYKPNVSARLLEDVLTEVLSDLSHGQVETAKARIAVTLQHFKVD